jgi:predicted small integral membrane protein
MYYIRIRLIIKLLQILALPDQDLMKPSGNYKVGIKSRESTRGRKLQAN